MLHRHQWAESKRRLLKVLTKPKTKEIWMGFPQRLDVQSISRTRIPSGKGAQLTVALVAQLQGVIFFTSTFPPPLFLAHHL